MKTFKDFVQTNEHLSENVFDQIKNAATMFRYMTNPKSFPKPTPSGPANLSGVYRGSSTPAPKPTRFQIGTPKPKPSVTPVPKPSPMGIRGAVNKGGVHGAVASAVLNAKNTADGTLDAAKARGDYKPKPRGMSNIPPAEAKPGSPSYVAPTKVQPRSVTTERPKPKPTGPVTSAQAIARGSTEGQGPKSAVSTYRDKADTKGTSVGRYKTLAQHRAAVAAQKNKM